MTVQTAVLAAPTGLTLTARLFTLAAPDTIVTGNTITVTERTNAKGQYVASIDRATALPAGNYTLILLSGTRPVAIGYRTFTGTDGETATVTAQAAELDSATSAKLARIEAVVSGTLSGAGTATEIFVGPSATVTVTVDADGNRSAVVVT